MATGSTVDDADCSSESGGSQIIRVRSEWGGSTFVPAAEGDWPEAPDLSVTCPRRAALWVAVDGRAVRAECHAPHTPTTRTAAYLFVGYGVRDAQQSADAHSLVLRTGLSFVVGLTADAATSLSFGVGGYAALGESHDFPQRSAPFRIFALEAQPLGVRWRGGPLTFEVAAAVLFGVGTAAGRAGANGLLDVAGVTGAGGIGLSLLCTDFGLGIEARGLGGGGPTGPWGTFEVGGRVLL